MTLEPQPVFLARVIAAQYVRLVSAQRQQRTALPSRLLRRSSIIAFAGCLLLQLPSQVPRGG